MFFITCCHFLSSRCMPELKFAITQPQKSVHTRKHLYTIDSGSSYTGRIGWRITDPSIPSNTELTLPWMDDKASSPCLKTRGTHRSGIQKSMDNTSLIHSFIHSDTFIFMIGIYLSPFKCLVRLITQGIHVYTGSSIPCPGTHTQVH